MSSSDIIEHTGIVTHVNDKSVKVSVISKSACGHCHARSSCSLGSTDKKEIEVTNVKSESFVTGEEIKVVLEQSLGLKALTLGYLLPFIILLSVLIITISIGVNEGISGLLALVSLIPYYICLSRFRESLKKEFAFRLKKM